MIRINPYDRLFYLFLKFFRTYLKSRKSQTMEMEANGFLAAFVAINITLVLDKANDALMLKWSNDILGKIWLVASSLAFILNLYIYDYKERGKLVFKILRRDNSVGMSLIFILWLALLLAILFNRI